MPDQQTTDIIRTTRRARIGLAALVASAIALLACYGIFVIPLLQSVLSNNSPPQAVTTLKLIWVGCVALGIVPALFLLVTGWKIRRTGRFPLPGAWVWRDTETKHGRDASRIAYGYILAGITGILFCTGLAASSWLMFDNLLSESALHPGGVILSEP